jgi:hypothetical protein
MASLAYLSNIRVMGQQFSQSVEAIKYIIEEAKGKTNQSLRLVCKKCSNFMLKMELNTRTSSCYEEEKEIVGACALKGANIFLNIVESTLQEFDRKRLILHCVDLVRLREGTCINIARQSKLIGERILQTSAIRRQVSWPVWHISQALGLWDGNSVKV